MIILALPMVASQACDTVMIFTDRLFLSKLRPELMNAAMGGGLTVFMMMSFFIGLTVAALVIGLRFFGLSPQAGWVVMVGIFLLFSFFIYLRYHTGKWRTLRVVEKEPVTVLLPGGFHEPIDL